MNKKISINGNMITISDSDIIGSGGEAEVYLKDGVAIKIFHDLKKLAEFNPSIPTDILSRRLSEKTKKIQNFPTGLPEEVVSPIEIARSGNKVIGYSMKMVPGAHDFRVLSKRNFREGAISNSRVSTLFLDLIETLIKIHGKGVIVGDLNDGNVLFDDSRAWIIDADSMQFNGYPCSVATEKYLDPHLYGKDLSSRPMFTENTDYYSVAVMLMSSLLYVGPYGGSHKTLKTWTRRAEARKSIFSSDVTYPRSAVTPYILPDLMLDYFYEIFEKGGRAPIRTEHLKSLEWKTCSCGLEYARNQCPCKKLNGSVKETVLITKTVKSTTVFKTKGRIITARLIGGSLRYVYEENEEIKREGGTLVAKGNAPIGTRFVIENDSTWIGRDEKIIRMEQGQPKEMLPTSAFEGAPIFSASNNGIVRIYDGHIVSAKRIGQIIPRQTWFSTSNDTGFGFYRSESTYLFFMFYTDKPHLKEVSIAPIKGKLIDARCEFSHTHILFMTSVENAGKTENSTHMIDKSTGLVVGHAKGDPNEARFLSSLHGKAMAGQNILSPTDDGIVLLSPDPSSKEIIERKIFTDTAQLSTKDSKLIVIDSSQLYIVDQREIKRVNIL